MGLLPARRDHEIALEIFAGRQLRLRRTAPVLRVLVHIIEPPEPEMHCLAHVPDADFEFREAVEYSAHHHAHGVRGNLHTVAPLRAVEAVVAEWRSHSIRRGSRMNVNTGVERLRGLENRK